MPVINMHQKPSPLEQHENHEFADVANQVSSAIVDKQKLSFVMRT